MRIDKRFWAVAVAICLAVGIVGCGKGDPAGGNGSDATDPDTPGTSQTNGNSSANDSGNPTTPKDEPPPKPTIPVVRLTDAERQTCILEVGQPMPDAQLPGLDGQVHPLRNLYGEKLTVVCFWTLGDTPITQIFAGGILADLAGDVAMPYAEKGVQVIAINEADSIENVDALAGEVDVEDENDVKIKIKQVLPIFLDTDGALFAQVASEKLPRIYVLDAEGNVLWFDMEFSETTRDDLLKTIRVALGEI